MGVFDNVIADFKCPFCAYELTKEKMKDTWQTKATLCTLDTYKVGDTPKFRGLSVNEGWIEIHHVCPKCNKFVQAEIEIKSGRLCDKVRYAKKISKLNL